MGNQKLTKVKTINNYLKTLLMLFRLDKFKIKFLKNSILGVLILLIFSFCTEKRTNHLLHGYWKLANKSVRGSFKKNGEYFYPHLNPQKADYYIYFSVSNVFKTPKRVVSTDGKYYIEDLEKTPDVHFYKVIGDTIFHSLDSLVQDKDGFDQIVYLSKDTLVTKSISWDNSVDTFVKVYNVKF